jgi:hypothetical protein
MCVCVPSENVCRVCVEVCAECKCVCKCVPSVL